MLIPVQSWAPAFGLVSLSWILPTPAAAPANNYQSIHPSVFSQIRVRSSITMIVHLMLTMVNNGGCKVYSSWVVWEIWIFIGSEVDSISAAMFTWTGDRLFNPKSWFPTSKYQELFAPCLQRLRNVASWIRQHHPHKILEWIHCNKCVSWQRTKWFFASKWIVGNERNGVSCSSPEWIPIRICIL